MMATGKSVYKEKKSLKSTERITNICLNIPTFLKGKCLFYMFHAKFNKWSLSRVYQHIIKRVSEHIIAFISFHLFRSLFFIKIIVIVIFILNKQHLEIICHVFTSLEIVSLLINRTKINTRTRWRRKC